MVTLHIDFQNGFLDDTIILSVNGVKVFSKKHLSTKRLLGLTYSLKTEIETGSVTIEANVPTKEIGKTIIIEVSADIYIGISIVNGMIEHIVSYEPFGYG